MAQASQGFHEREDLLSERTQDLHRAIVSLQEELEAVDWYQQRVDATRDPELRQILSHNRDEEKEHAMMLLEWLRRHDLGFARQLRLHVGKAGRIAEEAQGSAEEARGSAEEARGSAEEAARVIPPPGRGGRGTEAP